MPLAVVDHCREDSVAVWAITGTDDVSTFAAASAREQPEAARAATATKAPSVRLRRV